MSNGNHTVIQKIRDVIEKGGNIDINTRDVLLFSAVVDIYDQLEKTHGEYRAVIEQMRPMMMFYRAGLWFATVFGVSFIGLIFGMLTGQVEIVIK